MLAPIKMTGRPIWSMHRKGVGAQRVHRVIRVGAAVAVAVTAGVERDDMQTLVGQDLAGVFPGVSVLSAAVQEEYGGRSVAATASRFHSSAISVRPSTPRNFTVCSSLCPALTDVLSANPATHVTQRKIVHFRMVTKRRAVPSLQSAIVQPDSPNADDRQGIIDAAYGCLYEPHSGPIPVAAILERAGLSTRAFYRHFSSKDELFLAMLRQEADALAGRLDRITGELPAVRPSSSQHGSR